MKFCEKCQKEYSDDVEVCEICGQPLNVQEKSVPEEKALSAVNVKKTPMESVPPAGEVETSTNVASPADIEVERTSSLFEVIFKMCILIDDQEVGRVGSGNKVRVQVAPGIHEIRVKMPWCGGSSRPLSFQVKSGEFKRFRAGKTFGGFSLFTGLWMFKFIFSGGKIWKVEDY